MARSRESNDDMCTACETLSRGRNSQSLIDLAFKRYPTRGTVEKALSSSQPIQIVSSDGPSNEQLYSTFINETSFFDLKGRAAKWSRHSAADYHVNIKYFSHFV
jgi:hypothetical protein